jgi:DNA polymerase-3 subunit epsilon
VHGITTEFLRDKPKFEAVAADLLDYLQGAELIIHNAPFDLGFSRHGAAVSWASPPTGTFVANVIDTLVMAKEMYPWQAQLA